MSYKILGKAGKTAHHKPEKDFYSLYEKIIAPLMDSAKKRRLALAAVGGC